jgi:hypothetical protein
MDARPSDCSSGQLRLQQHANTPINADAGDDEQSVMAMIWPAPPQGSSSNENIVQQMQAHQRHA